jgi:FixJ family two-component response regulator
MTHRAPANSELFIVDDDDNVRDLLSLIFTHEGYRVTAFAEGQSFLAVARARTPACVLLDVLMPGRSGIDVLKDLDAQHYDAPIFVVSGRGEVPVAVDAMRHGAFDFIVKPFAPDAVVARVREAIADWTPVPAHDAPPNGKSVRVPEAKFSGQDKLTPRERDVLMQITDAASNKEAGRRLGISPRTVEVHRARIMDKLGAKNAADLVRIVLGQARAR